MTSTRKKQVTVVLFVIMAMAMSTVANAWQWTRNEPYDAYNAYSQLHADVAISCTSTKATFVGETNNAWCGSSPYVAEEVKVQNTYWFWAYAGDTPSSESNTSTNAWIVSLHFNHEKSGVGISSAGMDVYGRTKVNGTYYSGTMGSTGN